MCKSVKSVLAALCGVTALAALPAEVLAGPMSAASSNERWTNDVVRTSLLSGLSPRLLSPRLRHSGRRGWRSGWRRGRRGRRFGRGNRRRIGLRLSGLRLWRRVWRQFVLAVGPRRWLGVGLLIKPAPGPGRNWTRGRNSYRPRGEPGGGDFGETRVLTTSFDCGCLDKLKLSRKLGI